MNRFPFAPGVVQGTRRRWLGNTAQRRELLRWVWVSVLCFAIFGLSGLAAGLITGVLP